MCTCVHIYTYIHTHAYIQYDVHRVLIIHVAFKIYNKHRSASVMTAFQSTILYT